MVHELIKLPFESNALEPYIDKETIEIHHGKHHQGYVNNLNKILENYPELQEKPLEWLLQNLDSVSSEIKQSLTNQAGGVYNHNFFWSILGKGTIPESEILEAIKTKFGSFEEFKTQFSEAAAKVFGSGWTWLVLNRNQLEIVQTFNQESPLSKGMIPLITIDVWEHSYYLKYQNRRTEYIENFWNIINWKKVNELYNIAKQ